MTILEAALVLIATALAAMFFVAGVSKLRDRRGSRVAARAFGVPQRLASIVAITLPMGEITIAVLLLPTATRWWAAVAALALLLGFCAAIAAALARGKAPDCHCFGQLHSAPAGWRTLARNVLLLALAGLVVVAGHDDPGAGDLSWALEPDRAEWLVLGVATALVASSRSAASPSHTL